MASVTIHGDFRAQEEYICHYFHLFPFYLLLSNRAGCHDLSFLIFSFKLAVSLSSFSSSRGFLFLIANNCFISNYLFSSFKGSMSYLFSFIHNPSIYNQPIHPSIHLPSLHHLYIHQSITHPFIHSPPIIHLSKQSSTHPGPESL